MSDHQNIEELFRAKLGDAELTPSEGAWKGVQKKLARENFLRFSAGQFNIWYLAALLVGGITAIALLTTAPQDSPEEAAESVTQTEIGTENKVISEARKENAAGNGETEPVSSAASPVSEQKPDEVGHREELEIMASTEESPAGIGEADSAETGPEQEAPEILSPLLVRFSSSVTEGCAPLQVEFTNMSVNAARATWSFGNGDSSEEFSPAYIFEESGTYAVSLHAEGIEGDSGTFYQVIRVHPSPVAGFEIVEGLADNEGSISVEVTNYSTGGFAYSWDLLSAGGNKEPGWSSNEYQPVLRSREIPENARFLRMVVENEHACTDTAAAKLILLNGPERTLLFPTVFRANNNGPTGGFYSQHEKRRDIFHPNYKEEPAEYQLRIYSKMGEIVFETRDIHQGWDGYYMQERSSGGVYMWIAQGSWQNGTSFNLRGDVTLLWREWY